MAAKETESKELTWPAVSGQFENKEKLPKCWCLTSRVSVVSVDAGGV